MSTVQIDSITFTSTVQRSLSISVQTGRIPFISTDRRYTYVDKTNDIQLTALFSIEGADASTDVAALRAWALANGVDPFDFTDEFGNIWNGIGVLSTERESQNSYFVSLQMSLNYSAGGSAPDLSGKGVTNIDEVIDIDSQTSRAQSGDMKTAQYSENFESYTLDAPWIGNTDFIQLFGYINSNFYDSISIVTYKGTVAGTLTSSGANFNVVGNNLWSMGAITIERATLV